MHLTTTRKALSLLVLLVVGCGGSSDGGAANGVGSTNPAIAVSPLTLRPAFSPTIHDYAVQCAAGQNQLTIDMRAQGGTTRLVQPSSTDLAASQSVDVDLAEDQTAVVEMTLGESTESYWIRCLPHDFPAIVATPHVEVGTPSPGLYLISNTVLASGTSGFAMAVDANGTPIWYQRSSTGVGLLNVDLLPNKSISYSPIIPYTFDATTSLEYQIQSLDPPSTGHVGTVGMPTDHHELRPLPNGHYLLFSDVITTGVDLTGLQSFGADSSVINCAIQEVDETGAAFWNWHASDHFDAATESIAPLTDSVGGQNVVDPYHCNSIDVDGDGNLLVSARHMNSVFMIDKATGNVRWKLGGAAKNKDNARYIQVAQDPETAFYLQHDARFRPNGNISLFDDHGGMPGTARCVEYAIDIDLGVATVVWQSTGAASSAAMGSCRRYDDGTSVIGWGSDSSGRNLILSEIDPSGNDLLDLQFTPAGSSYRAIKVPSSALDANVLRKAAALP